MKRLPVMIRNAYRGWTKCRLYNCYIKCSVLFYLWLSLFFFFFFFFLFFFILKWRKCPWLLVEVQHSTAQTVYLPCKPVFSNKALSVLVGHLHCPMICLVGKKPTGESVDTVRDQKHKILGLLWAKPLEPNYKDKATITLERKHILWSISLFFFFVYLKYLL